MVGFISNEDEQRHNRVAWFASKCPIRYAEIADGMDLPLDPGENAMNAVMAVWAFLTWEWAEAMYEEEQRRKQAYVDRRAAAQSREDRGLDSRADRQEPAGEPLDQPVAPGVDADLGAAR